MSLFAGIYLLSGGQTKLPEEATVTICRNMSRSRDHVHTHRTSNFFIAYVDVGAFRESGFYVAADVMAAVAGEPLLDATGSRVPSRKRDLALIAEHLADSRENSILSRCRGSYALCYYNESSNSLLLATDKMGVRPIYYYIGNEFIYFSTCIRILEELIQVPKRMDLRGLTEDIVLGYTLGSRTPYADIKILLSGELLHATEDRTVRLRYFRIEEVKDTELSPDEFLDSLYESFVSAVACRSNRDEVAVSFLSGGLDSRCVVAVLKSLSKVVSAIVFDFPGSPDRVIAAQYSKLIGSRLTVRTLLPGRAFHESLAFGDEWYQNTLDPHKAYPQLVFSGDDGSISVGYVKVDEAQVRFMRESRIKEAIESFLIGKDLPRKVFRADVYQHLQHMVFKGVLNELERLSAVKLEKAFYFFQLENSHRRILRNFVFEDIDIRRIEYLEPFYDGDFIELIASAPAEWCLAHRLYHRWLTRFPEETTKIPWQTYPGHLACPVKSTAITRTQWQHTRAERFWASRSFLGLCWKSMTGPLFPGELIHRPIVLLAYALHRMKIRNYRHIMEICVKLSKYYERSGGRLVFPDRTE